jgi:hypothetical protein
VNWGRGLLRLWIVGTAGWIALIVSLAITTGPPPRANIFDQFDEPEAAPHGRVFDPTKPFSFEKAARPTEGTQHWARILTVAESALVPPFLVLVIGGGLFWALRGFGAKR